MVGTWTCRLERSKRSTPVGAAGPGAETDAGSEAAADAPKEVQAAIDATRAAAMADRAMLGKR